MRVSISTKIGDVTQSIDIEGDITVDDVAALIGHLALPIPEADQQREEEVLVTLEQLRQAVARNTDAVDAGDKLLSELSAQLRSAIESDDTEAAIALLDQLDTNSRNLASAVAENTPAQQGPVSTPINTDQSGGTSTDTTSGASGVNDTSGGTTDADKDPSLAGETNGGEGEQAV
jgi:hypothetical protein